MKISLPHNDWRPRPHQMALWRYLAQGGKRAMAVWHRRAGKDEICLHHAAVSLATRRGNYWHCLPEYAQGRKAIWTAVNPHTGKRRIDEAFPPAFRENTNDNEMFLRFLNGSTWQVIGSDRYNATVGAGVAGITYSEYALSNPSAWAFHRPMLEENDGWACFISTPRGRNHAYEMAKYAQAQPGWFYERLTAVDTGALSAEQLAAAEAEYIALHGLDQGAAQFRQEYLCDWASALLGSFYAAEMAAVRDEGRITELAEPDLSKPVHRAWDLGVTDDTSVWFFQPRGAQLLIVDHLSASGVGVEWYRDEIFQRHSVRGWSHGNDYVPHDAKVKEWGTGRTRVETMQGLGLKPLLVPLASVQDGVNAVRRTLPLCVFHPRCEDSGISALEQYRREWDDERKAFKPSPHHDWTSHACFIGDTQVLTRYGTQRIMDLPQTGEVLTPCGWKRYHSPRMTRRNAQLVEVVFTDGLTVRCTPDHLFKTASGWKSAESLTKGSLIQSSLTLSHSISMAASIACGLGHRITLAAARQCIAMFGRWHLETFLPGVTFITKIATQPTIGLITWNASQPASICQSHGTAHARNVQPTGILRRLRGMPLLNGISRKKDDCGIDVMPGDQRVGLNGSARNGRVLSVERSSTLSFVRAALHKFIAILIVKPLRIERVDRLSHCEDVYCLTVPDEEAFSLANGAIVHNCDSFRYLAQAWRAAPRPRPQEPPRDGWVIPPPTEPQRRRIVL